MFFNILISRQPFSAVYPNNGQKLNPNLKMKNIFCRSRLWSKTKYVNVTEHNGKDRFLRRTIQPASAWKLTEFNGITLVYSNSIQLTLSEIAITSRC